MKDEPLEWLTMGICLSQKEPRKEVLGIVSSHHADDISEFLFCIKEGRDELSKWFLRHTGRPADPSFSISEEIVAEFIRRWARRKVRQITSRLDAALKIHSANRTAEISGTMATELLAVSGLCGYLFPKAASQEEKKHGS